MTDIWRETVTVRFGSVDRSDRMSLWSIFNFFQEAALSHATDLGVGRDALARNRQGWILSRYSLVIARRPAYGETIEVSTWPRRWEKLFALRDYEIRDGEGAAVVRGRAGWLIFDIDKRKPLRPGPVADLLPPNDGIDALLPAELSAGTSACPAGLNPAEGLSKKMERTTSYSDIDYNGHVNNARYIQWIQDAADFEILTNAGKVRFDINYLSEVMPGEIVEILSAPIHGPANGTGPCFAFEGRRPGSGEAVFRSELRTG